MNAQLCLTLILLSCSSSSSALSFPSATLKFSMGFFPQGDKIYQGLGKITKDTQLHTGIGCVTLRDLCLCTADAKTLDQQHDSYQINVPVTSGQLLGYAWLCDSHHLFYNPVDCSTLQHNDFLPSRYFPILTYTIFEQFSS